MLLRLRPELLREVCFILYDDVVPDDASGRLGALSRLAQTCKTLFEPAADCLWHTIPSIALLTYLLPRDAWTVEDASVFWKSMVSDHFRSCDSDNRR